MVTLEARTRPSCWRHTSACATAFAALLLTTFDAARSAAQDQVLDLRFLELSDDGDRTYHNFVYSRPLSDRLSFEAFWLFLPQDDGYDELGAGVGFKALKRGDTSLTLIGYLAAAPDDEYFEPAILAVDAGGRLTGSVLLLRYLPLGDGGIEQWLVDPFEVQLRVSGRVALGASAYLYRPRGGSWLRKLGPKIALADRLGSSELALRRVNRGGGWELQLRRLFFF